jgi:hypothetical protein
MDRHPKALPHGRGHGRRRARRIVRTLLLREVQNLVGALVCPLGAARTRQQAGQPAGGDSEGIAFRDVHFRGKKVCHAAGGW